MKCLLLFPPQWAPFNPHLAGPAIASILKHHGHAVKLHDLNIAFYNTVLTRKFLVDATQSAFTDFNANAKKFAEQCPDRGKLKEQSQAFQDRYRRYEEILKLSRQKTYGDAMERVEWATDILRDREAFYDPVKADEALKVINDACRLLSATHFPSGVYFSSPNVSIYYSVERLKQACENVDGNVFYGFYEKLIPDLLKDNPEFIGISVGDYSQLLPGLTLAMLLKKASRAHICIGGNLFGRHTDMLVNNPDFFKFFADTVIYNEGEKPVIELLKHLEGNLDIARVPNLMHMKVDGAIVVNEEAPPYALDELYAPDYSGLSPARYFLPDPIYNLQTSRSCYWRKCSFCTHHFGSKYAVKPVEKVIDEIKSLQASHGARYFHFIDEALSPAYLRRLSEAIIEARLDINFYMYGRLERTFDQALFKLAHQAGLRMVLWGFESANARIYQLMNKGKVTDKNERLRILEGAHEAGVWNFLFLMFGFPTETIEEAQETVDFVRDNRHMLSHGTGSTFMLADGSPIHKNMEKFSITHVEKVRNGFNFAHRFTASSGMNSEERKVLDDYKAGQWRLKDMRHRQSSFREKLFLYLCRYSVQRVSAMNREIWL